MVLSSITFNIFIFCYIGEILSEQVTFKVKSDSKKLYTLIKKVCTQQLSLYSRDLLLIFIKMQYRSSL